MKILIDECAPRDLKFSFAAAGHSCSTVQEIGLSGKKNGELLSLAEGKFDVLLTLDKGIQFQQNLTGRKIAILLVGASRMISMTYCRTCLNALPPFNLFNRAKLCALAGQKFLSGNSNLVDQCQHASPVPRTVDQR